MATYLTANHAFRINKTAVNWLAHGFPSPCWKYEEELMKIAIWSPEEVCTNFNDTWVHELLCEVMFF